jgi:hypothetical protein
MGLVLVIVSITNIILQVVAAYLAYQYIEGKVKKKYRQMWCGFLAMGTMLQTMAVICYWFFGIYAMDNIRPTIPGLTVGSGMGVRVGFMLFFVAIGMEGIACFLTQFAKVSREELMEERRENEKFMAEVNMHQEAVDAANGAAQQGSYDYGTTQQGSYEYGTAAPPSYGYGQGPELISGPAPQQPQWGAAPPPQPPMAAAQPVMQAAW